MILLILCCCAVIALDLWRTIRSVRRYRARMRQHALYEETIAKLCTESERARLYIAHAHMQRVGGEVGRC
jgi:hypothetical protein